MKKFWKALGIAALAAAVPVRFMKNEETGEKTYQSLLISLNVGPGENGKKTAIGINIGEGVLSNAVYSLINSKKETIHFADDDPEAAVVTDVIDFTQADTDQAQAADDEAQDDADKAQDVDDEVAADEATAGLVEAGEEDFDPEL